MPDPTADPNQIVQEHRRLRAYREEARLIDSGRKSRGIARTLLALACFASALSPASAATLPSPLRPASHDEAGFRTAAAPGETALDLDRGALAQLRALGREDPVTVEDFPFDLHATGNLVLERFDVTTPDAKILLQTSRGVLSRPLPAVAHFRGHLAGEPDSRVYLGAQEDRLVAFLQTNAGIAYVGPASLPDGAAQPHVLRPAGSPALAALAPAGWRCDADELPSSPPDDLDPNSNPNPSPAGPVLRPAGATTPLAATVLNAAAVSIETDQELLAKFGGNATTMSAYIVTVMAAISTIYERDVQVLLTINRIQAWSSPDPYVGSDPRTQLNEVGDWWHGNRPMSAYPRTIVHFMSGKPVTGGIAWLGVLCQTDFSQGGHWGGGYGVTQVNGSYPASLWDLIGVAHEIGHNFGSPHTHCFSPAIDMCHGGESGCYSGPTVHPGPAGGTLMSYCHLMPGGFVNLSLRFHERCIAERMLPEIASVACLTIAPGGTPPVATDFYTVTPCRVVDTRNATGPRGGPALAANSDRTFAATGQCDIPSSARAISFNVTATQATSGGNLRIYAGGTPPPLASAISYRAGQTRANNGRAPLGTAGGLAVRCDQMSGNVHVIIDVNGYFQ